MHDYSSHCGTCVTYLQPRFKHLFANGKEGLGCWVIVIGRMDVKVVNHSRRVLVGKKSLGFKMKGKRCKKFKKTILVRRKRYGKMR